MADEAVVRPRRAPGDRVPYERLSDIAKIRVPWLWKPFIQRSAINLITGEPGVAKSTLACEIAAILSTGRPWPNETEHRAPQRVWLCNGEDGAADTIAWRLGNQGADPNNVYVTDVPKTITPGVVREMHDVVMTEAIAAVFIDPMQAWLGGGVDMNRANEMREWASMLRTMAMQTGCAVIFIRHKRKGHPGEKAIHAGLGSIDIVGFARSDISIVEAENGLRVMTRIKGNVGKVGGALAYTIEDSGEVGNDHGVLRWKLDIDPNTLVCKVAPGQSRTPRALMKAQVWLQGFLSQGPKPALECQAEGRREGFSETTIKRARKGIAVTIEVSPREWIWQLVPTSPSETPNIDDVDAA